MSQDSTTKDYCNLSLLSACKTGNFAKAHESLSFGADPNCRDAEAMTPLHYACRGKNIHIVSLLLHEGADTEVKDKNQCTAIHHVALVNNVEAAELLCKKANINALSKDNMTALHYALIKGKQKVAMILAEAKACPNIPNYCNMTAMHYAALYSPGPFLLMLLKNGGKADVKDTISSHTPLYYYLTKARDIGIVKAMFASLYNIDLAKTDSVLVAPVDEYAHRSVANPAMSEVFLEWYKTTVELISGGSEESPVQAEGDQPLQANWPVMDFDHLLELLGNYT